MSVTYSIDAVQRLICTTCRGAVTLPEVADHFRALRDDPACSGQLDVLVDISDVLSAPDKTQLDAVVTAIRAIHEKVQFRMCAFVATSDSVFGMMRMFEVFSTHYFLATRVFRDAGAARAWLAAGNPAEGPVTPSKSERI